MFQSVEGKETDQEIYVIMNPDGSAQREVQLPTGIYILDLPSAISPSGDWLAVFRGTTESPHELGLELYNIWEGYLKSVAMLLTPAAAEEDLLCMT
jgi:hypothetical protein